MAASGQTDDLAGVGQEFFAVDDRELLQRVRAGQDAAFAELFSRHAGAVRGFALRYANDVAEAEDIAAEAFFRVLQAVRRGSGPADNVRGYLLTVVRRLVAEWRVRRRDVPVDDEELSRRVDPDADQTGPRAEANLIARAFTSLPQRWRAVLWQVEVEGERPAVVARHFGLSANATAALARRARDGLRAAYLQAHVPSVISSTACRSVVDKLGSYTAGLVQGTEARRIRAHLAGCASCRAVHAELADVCAGLRRYAGAAPPLALLPLFHPGVAPKLAHALGGRSAAFAGKAAALGARVKLLVAATSMALVGGLGVTAGPLLLHHPVAVNADRGEQGLLPIVLPNQLGATGQHPIGGPGSGALLAPNSPTAPSSSTQPPSDPSHRLLPTQPLPRSLNSPANSGQGSAGSNVAPTSDQPAGKSTYQPFSSSTNPEPDSSVTLTPDIHTPARTTDPAQDPSVWSTVYTTDGTTVWITIWSQTWPARGR